MSGYIMVARYKFASLAVCHLACKQNLKLTAKLLPGLFKKTLASLQALKIKD